MTYKTKIDPKIVDRVLNLATTSTHDTKMGCVITDRRGRIVAEATNMHKTHPLQHRHAVKVQQPNKVYLHAEIAALVKCREQGHTLYVGRWRGDGIIGLAKPCPICFSAIHEAGIREVVYTESGGKLTVLFVD
ncbi:MAG: deaminase [Candidatus Thermoplasmatota archaeon]